MIKIKKILIFTIIFVFVFSSFSYALSPNVINEFINNYPNNYIYKIEYPVGYVNIISSPAELEFDVSDTDYYGYKLESGKSLVIKNPSRVTYYRMAGNGDVIQDNVQYRYILHDINNLVGYEGNINIYKWNGSSFFLPTPYTFLRDLVGQTRTILPVGFGIVSVTLLVMLFLAFWKSYLRRLI